MRTFTSEHTFNNSVSLMDGKVNNCGSNIDFGMECVCFPETKVAMPM